MNIATHRQAVPLSGHCHQQNNIIDTSRSEQQTISIMSASIVNGESVTMLNAKRDALETTIFINNTNP